MLTKLNSIREENENGFTLIELLVVIVIIGILATIAIPIFNNQRKSAIDAITVSDTKTLATAIETEAIKTPYEKMTTGSFAGTPLSAGTQWAMKSDAKGYCLQTFNAGGEQYKTVDSAATYDSSEGGVNKTGGACGAGGAGDAPGGSAMGAIGAISFIDSDNPGNTITADGSYSYDGSTQSVTYSFDFKNLEAGKTYYILVAASQNQGSDRMQYNNAMNAYTVSSSNTHVEATLSLKGVKIGGTGVLLTAPDKVTIMKGFAMNSGYGSADINDPSVITVK